MSKIIQITSAGNDGGMMLYALCDDGSIWEFCRQTGWVKVPLPIPSSTSDYAKCIKDLEPSVDWVNTDFEHIKNVLKKHFTYSQKVR